MERYGANDYNEIQSRHLWINNLYVDIVIIPMLVYSPMPRQERVLERVSSELVCDGAESIHR